ncbi:SDR family oxidoreductase [Desulfogranum marinum]|uniref:SDR family oxidoreductase n=1 Tax=Desulfogranum marinum TaxID=453220 RepID=UPI0019669033|nr:SDR family oxidoreductase [Desulfogranum marinum]MBM9513244.1 SDR family oxidoreductase [Desulfogranum marinum]
MDTPLAGKIALITGSSRGIGREIACKLAQMGAAVVINYNQSKTKAQEVCSLINTAGGKAIAIQADVRDVGQLEHLFDQTLEKLEKIDILVNNAGILLTKPIEQVSEEEYDLLFAANVKSVFFACQQAAKKLSPGGRIINISTTVTKIMMPGYGLYAASKGAVDQVTRVLSRELGEKNITVNAISPGPVDTELFRAGKSKEQIAQMAGMSPFNRIGTPADVAGAVALLVSDDAAWITGQNLYVNGGIAG